MWTRALSHLSASPPLWSHRADTCWAQVTLVVPGMHRGSVSYPSLSDCPQTVCGAGFIPVSCRNPGPDLAAMALSWDAVQRAFLQPWTEGGALALGHYLHSHHLLQMVPGIEGRVLEELS